MDFDPGHHSLAICGLNFELVALKFGMRYFLTICNISCSNVAAGHRGIFFDDALHWRDSPMGQKIPGR